MGRPAGRRLPIAPLDAALAHFNIDVEFIEGRLNTSIRQGRSRGYLTLDTADEVACKVLKMHPIVIWGETYMDVVHNDLGEHDTDTFADLYDEEEAA